MPLFNLPPRANRSNDTAVIKKAKKSKKAPATARGGGGIASQIANIKAKVLKELGQFADETLIIRDELQLSTYISKAIAYGEIAIDTETNGLDPLTDACAGVCLFVPDEKPTYIPINHVSYITMERVDNQLTEEIVAKYLKLLEDNKVRIIMFNAVFDIRVLKDQVGVKLSCYWDCKIASKMMNENEDYGEGGLKNLHNKYVLNGDGNPFDFDSLFKGVKSSLVPINIFAIYSAHDPKITWELYDFQRKYLYYNPDEPSEARNGMNGVAWTFFNIEMPIVEVVVAMEDTGVAFDVDYAKELEVKYTKLKEDALTEIYKLLEPYEQAIQKAIKSGIKLDSPVNIDSPQQLSILCYDILGYPVVDKRKPRGTGKAIRKKWNTDLANAISDYKQIGKLLNSFIIKLPNELNPNDKRVHGRYNQYGAKTGRFSSKNPNLQQIPSHNKDIRPMFVASDGFVLMSSDYSQQEPSCLATFCKEAGNTKLFDARFKGNDLYSEVAGACFNLPYEECCEFDKDHNKNPPEFKERRNTAKPVLLGILYGRGDDSVAEGMGITLVEAQRLKTNLFNRFPEIQQFEQDSLQMAKDLGYVTTVCGRKRRLPDLQLPEYEFKWEDGYEPVGDILDFDELEVEVPYSKQKFYITKLQNARGWKQRDAIIEKAKQEHIQIFSNRSKIAEATRQTVNSRIQGRRHTNCPYALNSITQRCA